MEVAVVGAGVVGLAVARELRLRGVARGRPRAQRDRCRRLGRPAGRRAPAVGHGGRVPARGRVGGVLRATPTSGSPRPFRSASARCGYLFVAHTRTCSSGSPRTSRVQNDEGVPVAARLTPTRRPSSFPVSGPSTLAGGAGAPTDGYFDRPQSVVEAFARGLEIRIGAVGSLDELDADAVVVAAGADTPRARCSRAADRARGPLPLLQRADPRAAARAARRLARAARSPRSSSANGRVLASDLGARGDESGASVARERPRRHRGAAAGAQYVSFPLLVRGEYDVTPDHQPMLGRVGERRSMSRPASAATAS